MVDQDVVRRVEVNGHTATADELRALALVNYGHFSTMQVRGRRVRGLGLHLFRLDTASRELFGTGLDGRRVRRLLAHALGDDVEDAQARVTVFRIAPGAEPSVMVSLRAPSAMPHEPRSLRSVPYQRPLAHLKHVGTFAQIYYGRLAEREGYGEALFVGPGGLVCEGSVTNIGFHDGTRLLWPDAPMLLGTTMQLLDAALTAVGKPPRRDVVRLADLASLGTAFICNSGGLAPVGRIDDVHLPIDRDVVTMLHDVFDAVPGSPI